MKGKTTSAWLVIGLSLVSAATARADIWKNVVSGFEVFDYQWSGQQNYLGKGWDINANAVYNGQNYDFGFAELTLGSASSPTPSNLNLGYTLRGIPKANFAWNTGGQPLQYTLKINNGIQDFDTIEGSILIDVKTDVNALGFYDTRVQISNRGTYSTDGYFSNQTGNLAFDVGPIVTSGNIFADALAAVTQPFFTAVNMENPFAKFSQKAGRSAELTATIEELRARIEAGEVLSDEEMAKLVNTTVMKAIIDGDSPESMLAQLPQAFNKSMSLEEAPTMRLLVDTPEPSCLLLLAAGAMLLRRRSCRA